MNFISPNDNEEEHEMHSKTDKIEIMNHDKCHKSCL